MSYKFLLSVPQKKCLEAPKKIQESFEKPLEKQKAIIIHIINLFIKISISYQSRAGTMGPTNTSARYRPPPPGMAPPPPPPGDPNSGMTGSSQHPPQQQSYYAQQQQPNSNYYNAAQHAPSSQPEQPEPSCYAQQPAPPQQQFVPTPGGYAARSAAANSPQRPITAAANNNIMSQSSQHSSTTIPNPTLSPKNKRYEETPFQAAEQSRLLTNSLQRLTEASYQMQHAMEMNDVVATLEQACLLLEELGDPNHGVNRGQNRVGGPQQPPTTSYYSVAGGAVPPLGSYNDRYYTGAGGNSNGLEQKGNQIAQLSPKNYYELHMRAMDEMPILEEYLLGLCHSIKESSGSSSPSSNYYSW
jgi:hypothetical protein